MRPTGETAGFHNQQKKELRVSPRHLEEIRQIPAASFMGTQGRPELVRVPYTGEGESPFRQAGHRKLSGGAQDRHPYALRREPHQAAGV